MKEEVKALAKKAARWTVPPGVHSAVKRIVRRQKAGHSFDPEMHRLLARNDRFKDIHKGGRCFILATGPSINRQDLKPLRNEVCMAISMFMLHKDIKVIDPMYHVDGANHPPQDFGVLRRSFGGFKRYYSGRTAYFFGHFPYEYSVRNFLKENPGIATDNIYYLDYSDYYALDEANYNNVDVWDIQKSVFAPRTTVCCAIQVAAYMGFRSIYLLGCDHDYLASFKKGASNANFYNSKESVRAAEERMPTEEILYRYHLRWKQYRLMRSYLEPRGVFIYNATEGGLLDVFPRVTLAEALGR